MAARKKKMAETRPSSSLTLRDMLENAKVSK